MNFDNIWSHFTYKQSIHVTSLSLFYQLSAIMLNQYT